MGLDITTTSGVGNIVRHERFGSYSTLHILRKWVYINEEGYTPEQVAAYYDHNATEKHDLKANKYPALLDHSDCDGGYIDTKYFNVECKDPMVWGDLDQLGTELETLYNRHHDMPEDVLEVLERFIRAVLEVDEEHGDPKILYFL